jgi:hypothetical protein
MNTCKDCHDAHALQVKVDQCGACHPGVTSEEDLRNIRISTTDFDGDGDTTEGIAGEVETMREKVYAAMQDYAANVVGTPIVYDPGSYPYYFIDTNSNGEPDPDEIASANQYNTWTRRLRPQRQVHHPGFVRYPGKYWQPNWGRYVRLDPAITPDSGLPRSN